MRFSGLRYPKRRSHSLKIEHLFPIQGSAPPLHASNTTNRSALATNTAALQPRAERFSGLRYPKRRSHSLKIEHLFPIQGSAPPLHASNTTNRSALATNTAALQPRAERFSGLRYPKRRSHSLKIEHLFPIQGSAPPLHASNTTNHSALATNTAALQPRAVRFSGLRYPKRRSHSLKIEHLFPIQGSAPPLHASNTTNRSALAVNTAVHFYRGRCALRKQGIRSAESISRNQVWHRAIPGSAPPPAIHQSKKRWIPDCGELRNVGCTPKTLRMRSSVSTSWPVPAATSSALFSRSI